MERDVSKLTAQMLRQSFSQGCGLIMSLASFEQLGSHGPLGADILVAQHVAPLIAEKMDALYAPVIPFGDTLEMEDFPGTVNISQEILSSYYYQAAKSYFKAGAPSVVFFLTHSLNLRSADQAARALHKEGHSICLLDWWKAAGQCAPGIIEDLSTGLGHGGEMITSVLLAIAPRCIQQELGTNEQPKPQLAVLGQHLLGSSSPYTMYGDFHDYCESGTWGNIGKASVEKGTALIDRTVRRLVTMMKEKHV